MSWGANEDDDDEIWAVKDDDQSWSSTEWNLNGEEYRLRGRRSTPVLPEMSWIVSEGEEDEATTAGRRVFEGHGEGLIEGSGSSNPRSVSIEDMPDELLSIIIAPLCSSVRCVRTLASVCKRWFLVLRYSQDVWKNLCAMVC